MKTIVSKRTSKLQSLTQDYSWLPGLRRSIRLRLQPKSKMQLLDLPDELLTKIFSYFDQDEVLDASKVCKRFNNISKSPSLWKKVHIYAYYRYELTSFCKFFTIAPFLQELSLNMSPHIFGVTLREFKKIKLLLRKLKMLRCLSISGIDISSVKFAPSVKRLRVLDLPFFYTNKCPTFHMLEHLHIMGELIAFNERIKMLLHKHESSLCVIDIYVIYYRCIVTEQPIWLPLIGNCSKLKKLKLYIEVSEVELNYLIAAISNLTLLEELYISYFSYNHSNSNAEVLSIDSLEGFQGLELLEMRCTSFKVRNPEFMIKALPKLATFLLKEDRSDDSHQTFFKFIDYNQSLRNIGYAAFRKLEYNDMKSFLLKMYDWLQFEKFDNICLCSFQDKFLCSEHRSKVGDFVPYCVGYCIKFDFNDNCCQI